MKGFVLTGSEKYLEEILQGIDFQNVNDFLNGHMRVEFTFEQLVSKISSQGLELEDAEHICSFVFDVFFYELSLLRPMFMKMLVFSLLFSILHKFLYAKNKYISDIGFWCIYATLMVLLMQTFLLLKGIALEGMDVFLAFLNALIPTFAIAITFTGNVVSGIMVYELAFVLVYLVEWGMKYVLSPMIQVFILVLFLNHLFDEEKLSNLANFLEEIVQLIVKASFGVVIGLGVVQSMLTPAKDRIAGNTLLSGLSSIPGVGDAVGTAGELILSCGMLIKNSIGVAGLLILFLLAVIPLLKMGCFWIMYHVLGVLLEPVCDKRIIDCISGVIRGCNLYFRLMLYTMMLFFVLISMVSIATSFVY